MSAGRPDSNANDAMAQLRLKYAAQLADRRVTLQGFLSACEKESLTEELCLMARKQAHSLVGTGGTYGFADISKAGRALEMQLDNGERNGGTLAELTRILLTACEQANSMIVEGRGALGANGRQKPVLLTVDDDPEIREIIAGLFSQDAEIFMAANGREGLAMIEQHRPDMVILDNEMPELTGLQALQKLRSIPHLTETAVIMLTSSNTEKDIMQGMISGAVDYITKPFDPQQLVERVRDRLKNLSYTVLLVDDEVVIRDLLVYKFRSVGCRVITAENGTEALAKIKEHHPDLVILDRMMPGLDGLAVLHKMRADEQLAKIPVLFLTAKKSEQDVLEGFRSGAADYIVKPFRPEEVLARSLRLLKGEG